MSDPRIAMILNKLEELEPIVSGMQLKFDEINKSISQSKAENGIELRRLKSLIFEKQEFDMVVSDRLDDLEAKSPRESGINDVVAAVASDVKRVDIRESDHYKNLSDSLGDLRRIIDHLNSEIHKEINQVDNHCLEMLHNQDARIDAYKPVLVDLQLQADKYQEKLQGVNANAERLIQNLSNRLKEFADGFPEIRRLAEQCDKKVSICEKMCDAMQNKLRNYEARLLKIEQQKSGA